MRKIKAVFTVLMKDNLNYRAQAVVWILTSVIPIATTSAVWLASFGGSDTLGAFHRNGIIIYFLGALVLSNIITSSVAYDMGQEIKSGKLSFYLVRPLSYVWYQFMANVAWRGFRTLMFLPFLLIVIFVFWRPITSSNIHLDLMFIFFVIMAHLLSFFISFTIGCFALFMEDMSSIAQIYMLFNILLSGQIAPLALMPHSLQSVAYILPFRYVLSLPLEYLTGTLQDTSRAFYIDIAWVVAAFILSQIVFQSGVRKYSAVGQ